MGTERTGCSGMAGCAGTVWGGGAVILSIPCQILTAVVFSTGPTAPGWWVALGVSSLASLVVLAGVIALLASRRTPSRVLSLAVVLAASPVALLPVATAGCLVLLLLLWITHLGGSDLVLRL